MSEANTQSVTVLTSGIVAEMVARHLRGATVRKAIIGATGQTAKVFLNYAAPVGRGTPKTAGVALLPSDNGYVFCFGNSTQSASFGDALWVAHFARQA
jgi:hypothetical protein